VAEIVGELLVKIGADVGDLRAQLADIGLSLDKPTRNGRHRGATLWNRAAQGSA
jgi:hypothetical protein